MCLTYFWTWFIVIYGDLHLFAQIPDFDIMLFLSMTTPNLLGYIPYTSNMSFMIFLCALRVLWKINLILQSKLFKVMEALNSLIIGCKNFYSKMEFFILCHAPIPLLKMAGPNASIAILLRQVLQCFFIPTCPLRIGLMLSVVLFIL